jgi:hypothetical protein
VSGAPHHPPRHGAGDPENRSNARLERENTALGLESDELKAQQVTMEAHQVTLERLIDINRALLDASVDGIRLVDLAGRSLLANSVIEQLTTEIFGLPRYATLQDGRAIADRLTDPYSGDQLRRLVRHALGQEAEPQPAAARPAA